MLKFLYSVGLIALGLILGQVIRKLVNNNTIKDTVPVSKYIKTIQYATLLGLNPVITLGAFWIAQLNDLKFIALPILGAIAITIGGVMGFTISKIFKHEKKQTGSMFVSGAFTNMGNFGGCAT